MKILIYGIGNPGRQDDALGSLLVERMKAAADSPDGDIDAAPDGGYFGPDRTVDFETNFQLNIEDALLVSAYDTVIFADARDTDAENPPEPNSCRITRVAAESPVSFSTHAMNPGGIMALAAELYNARPEAWLLEMPGYSWEPNQALSAGAEDSLECGIEITRETIRRIKSEDHKT